MDAVAKEEETALASQAVPEGLWMRPLDEGRDGTMCESWRDCVVRDWVLACVCV